MVTFIVISILCFPLIGFLVSGLGMKHLPKPVTTIIGPGAILASFLLSLALCLLPGDGQPSHVYSLFTWIPLQKITVTFSLLIDPLTKVMLLVVTGVGFLIHVYSLGYMNHDEGFNRFFAYMNLFVFSMLLLVMGSNYAILFMGWEGVGLCSYLLIGFWFKNQDFNNAAKKAFIMNRIGDLGFLLGMFLIFTTFGSLDFQQVFLQAKGMAPGNGTLIAITLLLLMGAVGKSAQIPLYTWLPDAMAGPTPVSALIHAATMVTAGIYLVARSNILFALAPVTMLVIIIIGLATAILAAVIALFQNDIKKILAYSTISQLGYMFLALGLGAFTGAMFHLTTHAFFKALLFLGAGSVIHALHGEQNIRNMGGLRKTLPKTWLTFLAGTLAISGIPPLSGFFSKDQILLAAFGTSTTLWILALAGALLTAFYMLRLLILTFSGSFRGHDKAKGEVKESPGVMTIPMIILALLALFGGMINLPEFTGLTPWLEHSLAPVFSDSSALMQKTGYIPSHSMEILLGGVTTLLVVGVIILARTLFRKGAGTTVAAGREESPLLKAARNKFYIDELYDLLFVRPLKFISEKLYSGVEIRVIDRAVEGIGKIAVRTGNIFRYIQTGHVGFYLFMMVAGILAVLLFNLVVK